MRFTSGLLLLVSLLLAPFAAGEASHDNNVWWNELYHDSRDPAYRAPMGPVVAGTAVRLRFRAAQNDLTSVKVRVWNDRANTESLLDMTVVASDGTYDWWEATLNTGSDPNIFWYRFIAGDGSASAFYEDDAALDGSAGAPIASTADRSWQITVYDAAFHTPDWAKNAIFYQIFPDRFRNGNPSNDTPAGSFFYGENSTILRSNATEWNTVVCDPRSAGPCQYRYSDNFYGGDLQGVIDKLDYLQTLGVTALYLNPIFSSPSNHRYDTTDYMHVASSLGGDAVFDTLMFEAHTRGMHVVLDGVFNHTSSDSVYFDRYNRYGGSVGACEDVASPYRPWYTFSAAAPAGTGVCAGDTFYYSWFGYDSLPKLSSANAAVRQQVANVATHWVASGPMRADGWRLDVGGDVDPGAVNDPSNDFWEGFRTAVRNVHPDAYISGEEWGNGSPWLLGREWDAVMNYQFAAAVLSFWRDETFVDNDHAPGSSSGPLAPIGPSQLSSRLWNLKERYPDQAFSAMMNLLDSHDTNRLLFMLDHNADQNDSALYANPGYDWSDARRRAFGAVLLQMTLPGAPTIYYGDEVGLVGPPRYDGGKWEDDPYNRAPYPWLDESGVPYYTHLQSAPARTVWFDYYAKLAAARNAHPALRTGSLDILRTDDAHGVLAYGRKLDDDAAIVIANKSGATQVVILDLAGYLPGGLALTDAVTNASYTVDPGGLLTIILDPLTAALLVPGGSVATPPAPVVLDGWASSGAVTLSFTSYAFPSSYDVYRSLMPGGPRTLVHTLTHGDSPAEPISWSDTGLTNGTMYYYVVVGRVTSTGLESDPSNEFAARPVAPIGWCNLQWPFTITHVLSATTPTVTVYGQIWMDGITSLPGPAPGVRARVGYGPLGTTPDAPSWKWWEMSFNVDTGNNDEFKGTMLPDTAGTFHYAILWSNNNGATWLVATQGGPGFDETRAGDLTVLAAADTTPPGPPSNLHATTVSSSFISLAWDPSSDDVGVVGYRVYRGGGGTVALVATVPGTSWTDTSVVNGQEYTYDVEAFDDAFNVSPKSNILTVTAAPRDVTVTFSVDVPSYTPGVVYVAGSIAALGNWSPSSSPMVAAGTAHKELIVSIPEGTQIEYKYTRGSWETVEKWGALVGLTNRSATITWGAAGAMTLADTVELWRDPLVVSHVPAAGASAMPSTTIQAVWSEPMASGVTGAVTVDGPTGLVAGNAAYDDPTRMLTFTPSAPLAPGSYMVSITGATDAQGDVQQVPASWGFDVAAAPAGPERRYSFAIYNQGRGAALPSSVRAVVSDHPPADAAHRLGTGLDAAVAVSTAACATENCTPALLSGALASYTAVVPLSPEGGFGRLSAGPGAAPVTNGFLLTSGPSTHASVRFDYGRWLLIEADAARNADNVKLDQSLQKLAALQSNDRQGVLVGVTPPRFGELTHLSATFSESGAGDGTVRLAIHLVGGATIVVRLGNAPAFNDALLAGWSGYDVIRTGGDARFDLRGVGGGEFATWEEAEAAAGDLAIEWIELVAGGPARQLTLSGIEVGTD